MFLWYIEFAAKDRQHAFMPDTEGWQAKLIADATRASMPQTPTETDRQKPTPPLKRAG